MPPHAARHEHAPKRMPNQVYRPPWAVAINKCAEIGQIRFESQFIVINSWRQAGSALVVEDHEVASVAMQPARLLDDFLGVWKEGLLERRAVGHGRVQGGDPHERPVEVFKGMLADDGGEFATETTG